MACYMVAFSQLTFCHNTPTCNDAIAGPHISMALSSMQRTTPAAHSLQLHACATATQTA